MSWPNRVLVAPNAFKGTLHAQEASGIIARILKREWRELEVIEMPIADGGDDTRQVLHEALQAEAYRVAVKDPVGNPITAAFSMTSSRLAILEMSDASGYKLLKPSQRNPEKTTSFGTGQLMQAALDQGAADMVLGVGGSATVDGGLGALAALGCRFFDRNNNLLKGDRLRPEHVDKIESTALDPRWQDVSLTLLSDVNNPLTGGEGAARVFAPQKGADDAMVERLEKALQHWERMLEDYSGKAICNQPFMGAAGGITAGLHAVLGANLVYGSEWILDQLKVDHALQTCDVVITGEGSMDSQSEAGKAPVALAQRAKKFGVPVIALAGFVPEKLPSCFDAAFSIVPGPVSLEDALNQAPQNLERTVRQLVRMWKLK